MDERVVCRFLCEAYRFAQTMQGSQRTQNPVPEALTGLCQIQQPTKIGGAEVLERSIAWEIYFFYSCSIRSERIVDIYILYLGLLGV